MRVFENRMRKKEISFEKNNVFINYWNERISNHMTFNFILKKNLKKKCYI